MKKLLTLLIAAILAVGCCFGLNGCGKEEKIAALICLHGDSSSYDKNFIDAFEAACKAKGLTKKQYTIVTDVPEEGDDCYNKAASFADAGYKVVFADSFGHEANIVKAAKAFPDVTFCHATGTQASLSNDEDKSNDTPANFHDAFASIYEGRYLAGVAAGWKLKELYGKNGSVSDENAKVGYVGAWPYAEVISGYTAWFLGVRSVVPNATMTVKYTYSWYDETREKETAKDLIDNCGCKLISGHADSMGVPTACKEKDVPNVFYNGTQPNDQFIIASKINWQPYFELMIESVMENKELVKDYTGTLKGGSVQLTDFGPAKTTEMVAAVNEAKTKLLNGEIKVFDCSTFTVNNAKADSSKFSKAAYITVDENGHLTKYLADVIDDGKFVGETNVIENGVFCESKFRSAPYFDLIIDGVTVGGDLYSEADNK